MTLLSTLPEPRISTSIYALPIARIPIETAGMVTTRLLCDPSLVPFVIQCPFPLPELRSKRCAAPEEIEEANRIPQLQSYVSTDGAADGLCGQGRANHRSPGQKPSPCSHTMLSDPFRGDHSPTTRHESERDKYNEARPTQSRWL